MTTIRFIQLSFLLLFLVGTANAFPTVGNDADNVHKEWVFIIKCAQPQASQSASFDQLLAQSTVMNRTEHEIILLVNQAVMDSFTISDCGCVTQQSMPLFRSALVEHENDQAKTELIATRKNNSRDEVVLKLLFNRLPSSYYSPLIPMHAASMTLLPEYDNDIMHFTTLD